MTDPSVQTPKAPAYGARLGVLQEGVGVDPGGAGDIGVERPADEAALVPARGGHEQQETGEPGLADVNHASVGCVLVPFPLAPGSLPAPYDTPSDEFGDAVIAARTCRFCRSGEGEIVLDLGRQPSSELFPVLDDPGPDLLFPLRMWLCASCGLAQLADDADVPEEVVGAEPAALAAQRADAVRELVAAGALPPGGTAAEFPSPHGGSWLGLLAEHGFAAVDRAVEADVVVDGSFGVMHEPDQCDALRERTRVVRPGGRFVVQFHSLHAIVAGSQWNAL